jgi:hypothetical protein
MPQSRGGIPGRSISACCRPPLRSGVSPAARFRLTVVPAYDYTCALTGYRCVTVAAGSIVDAAHIHQFANSRNNHPQNGIALCKNAHWMFDAGLWSLDDNYRVIVAPDRFNEAGAVAYLLNRMAGRRKLLLYRAREKGEILRLKPGLYCLAPDYRKSHPHPFVIAAALHSPSHVSLESALWYHSLIPEAVVPVSSVTARRSRSFQTPLGVFAFYRVPADNPRAGVKAEKIDDRAWAFVASPLRAIADLIYLRKRVAWATDGLRFLTDSMRIEEEDLRRLSLKGFDEVYRSIRNRRTRTYLAGLRKEIKQ